MPSIHCRRHQFGCERSPEETRFAPDGLETTVMSTADFMDLMGGFWVQGGVSSHVALGTRYQTMLKIWRILEYLGIVACAVRKLKFAAEPIPIPSEQQTYQVSSGRKEYSGGWDGKSRES